MPEDSQSPSTEPMTPTPSASPASETPITNPVPEVPNIPAYNPASAAPEAPAVPASPAPQPAEAMPTYQPPMFSQPIVSQPMTSTHPTVAGPHPRKLKKPLLVSGIAVIAAVLIGGGLVFGLYLPNTPDNVYGSGLDNTGKALDTLVAYTKSQENVDYKSFDFDGTLKVASPGASFDFDSNGSIDDGGNATATMALDLMGNKGSADIRSVVAKGNTSPDVYFKVDGVKSYLDSNGLGSLDSLDGQWISIDHTLLDTYASQLKGMTPGGVSPETTPSYAQVLDAETKVQAVNRQYIFTTNASTAVLANEKYVGQTKANGRTSNHYQVGYNRDHLEAYAKALAAALDASKLNDWSKQANKGRNLSDVTDLSTMESDTKTARADYTFDLWVDTGTKLVSKVSFTDPESASETFAVALNYTGGDDYPLVITFNGKDDNGNPQQFTFGASVNMKTNKANLNMNGSTKDSSGTTTIALNMNATPSKQDITVSAPTGAKSVNEILNELGLGGLSAGGSGSSDTPLFFQQ